MPLYFSCSRKTYRPVLEMKFSLPSVSTLKSEVKTTVMAGILDVFNDAGKR